MNKRKLGLNITLIGLTVATLTAIVLGYSIISGNHYFGFFSVMQILILATSMAFLLSVYIGKNQKIIGATLLSLIFLRSIKPIIDNIMKHVEILGGNFGDFTIPSNYLELLKKPLSIDFGFTFLYFILVVLCFVVSIYLISSKKKYTVKEILIIYLAIFIPMYLVEVAEKYYLYISLFKLSFSFKILLPQAITIVFDSFIIMYLAKSFKNSEVINLVYYTLLLSSNFVMSINTIIRTFGYVTFAYTTIIMVLTFLVYLYCLVMSVLIFQKSNKR